MPDHFVFLEPRDPEILAFFNCFRDIVGSEDARKPIHVTLKGPTKRPPFVRQIKSWHKRLTEEPLFIGNPGVFDNPTEIVVYLRVEHPRLRSLWYKPSFPIAEYGWNPHISVYRGKNRELGRKIWEFLKINRVELLSRDFAVTVYTSKQPLLFDWIADYESVSKLIELGRLSPDFFDRLRRIVQENYESKDDARD